MPVTNDITATYRAPRKSFSRFFARGPREDRALAVLMGAAAIMFVANWPQLARKAHLSGEELNPLLGSALLGLMIFLPLIAYTLAALSFLIGKVFRSKASAFEARFALFWALLAASPAYLLWGLVAGFIGPGAAMTLTGALWLGVFLLFWGAGLWVAAKGTQ